MIPITLEIGLILLLIYLPLAAGGVTEVSVALLEVLMGLLVVGWGISLVFNPQKPVRHRQRRHHRRCEASTPPQPHQRTYWLHVTLPPALGALMVFALFIIVQSSSWPANIVEFLSPTTLELYAEAASNTFASLPSRLPFSVMTQASETELGKFVAYILLFFVVTNVIRTQAQIQRILVVLLFLGGLEAVYGLSQVGQARIAGTFVNHNHFAGYLEMLLPLAFGLLLAQLEARSSSTGRTLIKWVDDKYLKAMLIGVLILVLTLAIFLSGSRGGIISFSLGMMCFCALAYSRRLLRKWVRAILICAVVVFGIAVFASPEALLQRLGALAKPTTDTSFQYRWNVWKNSLEIVRDFPLIGAGLGTFSHLFARYQKFPSDLKFTHAENDYVQLLTETGVVGMGIMCWGIIAYGWTTLMAWRRQHSRWPVAIGLGGLSALVSTAVHSIVDFNLHIPSNAVVFTVIAALTYILVHFEREEETKTDSRKTVGMAAAFNPPGSSSPSYVCRTRKIHLPLSRIHLYAILLIEILLICGFVIWTVRTYAAFLSHRQFREIGEMVAQGYLSGDDLDAITLFAKQSLRYDENNADYHFALGSYLYQHAARQGNNEAEEYYQILSEAEQQLKQAVLNDPANPWYYYELGNMRLLQGACQQAEETPLEAPDETLENVLASCLTARYYLQALRNAPNNAFLRRFAGTWFYQHNQDTAVEMMMDILSRSTNQPISEEDMPEQIAQFLYDMHLDYESERWQSQYISKSPERCDSSGVLSNISDARKIEMGHDDNSAEWRTFLSSDAERVHKVICLPDNINDYSHSLLKVLMNNAGSGDFVARIFIDDVMIKEYTPASPVPRNATWHEIPFDISLLRGKERIHVYIRVSGASWHGNCLQIWGDQHTSRRDSTLNFNMVDDLSLDAGIQTGEYMIRLALKRDDTTL